MEYCTGEIKKIYIKSITLGDGIQNIVTDSIVVKHNAPFYWKCFGKLISIEYNAVLPTKDEAECFVTTIVKNNPERKQSATCIYVDYNDMKVHKISRKDFVLLKKEYKKKKS